MLKKNKGFTLVELIIVIAILAIIMLIAIPNFSGIQQRMQVRADKATAAQIGKAFRVWYTEYNSDPAFKTNVDIAWGETYGTAPDAPEEAGKATTFPGETAGEPTTFAAALPSGDNALTVAISTIPYLINYVDTTLLPTSLRDGSQKSEPTQQYFVGLTGTGTGEKVVVSIGTGGSFVDGDKADNDAVVALTSDDVTYDGTTSAVAYLEP